MGKALPFLFDDCNRWTAACRLRILSCALILIFVDSDDIPIRNIHIYTYLFFQGTRLFPIPCIERPAAIFRFFQR
jgi:hypothetical protein